MLAIVIPTYDRSASLRSTIAAVLDQVPGDGSARVVVVDNNSGDDTADVCASFAPRLSCVFEPRQGLSHARNAGIAAVSDLAPADVIAFTDDDVRPAPGWIAAIRRAFAAHPEVDCVGGPVLPLNPDAFPAWLTRAHWAPLALQDHGPEERLFGAHEPLGLVGANFAFRKRVFDRLGGFSEAVQRVRAGIGSTEDHEFLHRLYTAGGRALYSPDVVVHTEVPPERLTRSYHRRWHRGHGRFHAVMRLPELEAGATRVAGVPLHLLRSAARDALSWSRCLVRGDRARAFTAETRLLFVAGFLEERWTWTGQ